MLKRPKAVYLGKTTRTPGKCTCLNCGKVIDAGTGIGHRYKPRAGAIAICFYCGHVMAYDSRLQFRPLTDEEIVGLAGNEVILKAQTARAMAVALKKAREG
jgi:hypothetical protein